MDIRKEAIRFSLILALARLLLSCNYQNSIVNVVEFDIKNKIHLKKTEKFESLFESDIIQIYEITDASLLKDIPNDYAFYNKENRLTYCASSNPVNKYLQDSKIFYKVIDMGDGEFSAVFVDCENRMIIYHEVSYVVK